MDSYSQRDFAERWQEAMNDSRVVFMLGDTVAAFIAGAALSACVIFGLVM